MISFYTGNICLSGCNSNNLSTNPTKCSLVNRISVENVDFIITFDDVLGVI
jgi:hypothetical protein